MLYLFLLIGAWWLTPIWLRHGVRDALQEFQAPLWQGAGFLHRIKNTLQLHNLSKGELITEIEALSRELAHMKLIQDSAISFEDPQLRMIAKDGPFGTFQPVFTRILRRNEKTWWQEMIISGGRNRGIGENMAIVTGRGLLGKTYRTFSRHSVAILITDPRFRTVAHFCNDPRPIIFQGISQGGLSNPMGRVTKVPADVCASKERPLKVVTSSLSGIYPDGTPIGVVVQLRRSSDDIFLEGDVVIDASLAGAREAVILVPNADAI
ncbi:MAG: rod shape-determining protein MreC [Puniceicoccales bacterium]|nr:rod shape-determining protein MreC [Puniceicoccales bacterium]